MPFRKLKYLHVVITFGLIAHPLIVLTHFLFPSQTMIEYLSRIDGNTVDFLVANKKRVFVLFISVIVFVYFKTPDFRSLSYMRLRHFLQDVVRYSRTQNVSPLMVYYLLHPPVSYSKDLREHILDRFYPVVVQEFKRLRAIETKHLLSQPPRIRSGLNQVGWYIGLSWLLLISILSFILYFLFIKQRVTELGGWDLLLVPIAGGVLARIYAMSKAIGSHLRYRIDITKKMKSYFGTDDPAIPWADLHEQSQLAEKVLNYWKKDSTYRQLKYHELLNNPPSEVLFYTLNHFADRPFPADELIHIENEYVETPVNPNNKSNVILLDYWRQGRPETGRK